MIGLILQGGRDPDEKYRQIENANVGEAAPFEPELAALVVNQERQSIDDNLDEAVKFDAPEDDNDEKQPEAMARQSLVRR